MKKKSKVIALGLISIILIAGISIPRALSKKDPARLSGTELLALRDQYPVIYQEAGLVSVREVTLDEAKSIVDTFVYGKIVGEVKTYSEKESTGIDAVDEKHAELGGFDEFSYFGYTVEILDDTENLFKKGDIISVDSSSLFADTIPHLKENMLMIFPISDWKNDSHPNRYNFIKTGMYYVTPDHYTLSVFEEASQESLSGNAVEETLNKLKK